MKIIDTSKLQYDPRVQHGFMKIDDEHIYDIAGYNTTTDKCILGMKPLGRIYFGELKHLNYTDGTPVEVPYISNGERGMEDKYLKAGQHVYTEEMVVNIINSRCYDDSLLPKLPFEVYELLKELTENKGKNKASRAKLMLEKYEVAK